MEKEKILEFRKKTNEEEFKRCLYEFNSIIKDYEKEKSKILSIKTEWENIFKEKVKLSNEIQNLGNIIDADFKTYFINNKIFFYLFLILIFIVYNINTNYK